MSLLICRTRASALIITFKRFQSLSKKGSSTRRKKNYSGRQMASSPHGLEAEQNRFSLTPPWMFIQLFLPGAPRGKCKILEDGGGGGGFHSLSIPLSLCLSCSSATCSFTMHICLGTVSTEGFTSKQSCARSHCFPGFCSIRHIYSDALVAKWA